MKFSALPSLVLLGILLSGCNRDALEKASLPPEPWASKPSTTWPQIVLTNNASFKGHSPLQGASAFLIRTPQGAVLGASAAHLLGANGGVEPEVRFSELDSVLESWVLHPRTLPDQKVNVAGLGGKPQARNKDNDWLLLRLASSKEALPGTPLRLRSAPVRVGETVHLIGVSYEEPDVTQKVYSGKVTKREFLDRFRFDLNPPVNIVGFSGAPIVDDAGLVVGVMSVSFTPRKQGTKYLECGGEDAVSGLKLLGEP